MEITTHPPVSRTYTRTLARRVAWPAFVVLFYSLLTLWLLWPFPLLAGEVMLHRGDPIHQLWTLRWTQHALFTDPLNLFAANANYPYDAALTLNQPMYTNALLTAPIQALFRNQVLTHNVAVLLSFVLSGVFTALLVQELTGNRWAALAAGVLFAFAPVRQAHIFHLNLLSGYWTPLVLWCLHRLWRSHQRVPASASGEHTSGSGGRSTLIALLLALAFAAQVLAEFYHAIYLALAVGLFLFWQLVARRWGLTWRGTALLAGGLAFGALLTLPVVLPTVRAWDALDLQRSIEEADRHGARLENYLVTDRRKRIEYGTWQFNHHSATSGAAEHSLYPGLLALPLAVVGVFAARERKNRDALLYLLIALVAFFLSFGPTIRLGEGPDGIPSPLYVWIYEHVPGFSGTRVPSRFAMLVQLGLAVLSGYGLARLMRGLAGRQTTDHRRRTTDDGPPTTNRPAAMLVAVAVILFLALDSWGPEIHGMRELVGEPLPQVYTALAQQPPGAVLKFPVVNADEMLPHRYEYYSTFHWRPLVNSGSGILPQAYIDLRDTLNTFPDPRAVTLLRDLEVRYVVVHRYQMSGWEGWWGQVQATPGIEVLAVAADMGDVLLEVRPINTPTDLTAARWTGADGQPRMLLETTLPLVLDRANLYERWHTTTFEIEHHDGRVTPGAARLPTYLSGGAVGFAVAALPDDAAALHLTTARGTQRITLETPPEPERPTEGPQLVGPPLPERVAAGAVLPCRVYGRGAASTPNLVLSLNLLDAAGQVRAKQDRFFNEGFAPPEHWPATGGEPVPCAFPIPADLPTGEYRFEIGLYDPASAQFVPLADPAGNMGAYWSRSIQIEAAQ